MRWVAYLKRSHFSRISKANKTLDKEGLKTFRQNADASAQEIKATITASQEDAREMLIPKTM
jgi:hypothetical protein